MEIKIKHRGLEIAVQVTDVVVYGNKTKGGLLTWRQGVYDKQANYHVKKVGNEKTLKVELLRSYELSRTMQKELPGKVLEAIYGELGPIEDIWVYN